MDRLAGDANSGSTKNSVFCLQNLDLFSVPIRLLLVLFAAESSRCHSCTEFVVEPKFGGDFLQREIRFVFPANRVHTR